jgi:hypothetical protein
MNARSRRILLDISKASRSAERYLLPGGSLLTNIMTVLNNAEVAILNPNSTNDENYYVRAHPIYPS